MVYHYTKRYISRHRIGQQDILKLFCLTCQTKKKLTNKTKQTNNQTNAFVTLKTKMIPLLCIPL